MLTPRVYDDGAWDSPSCLRLATRTPHSSENVTVPFSPLVRQEGGHSCPPLRRGCFRRASVGPELGE